MNCDFSLLSIMRFDIASVLLNMVVVVVAPLGRKIHRQVGFLETEILLVIDHLTLGLGPGRSIGGDAGRA